MRFITTLVQIVCIVLFALFTVANWTTIVIHLWPPYELVVQLPILILGVLILGALPGVIVHRAQKWVMERRLKAADARIAVLSTRIVEMEDQLRPPKKSGEKEAVAALPDQAQPQIVPPAGA